LGKSSQLELFTAHLLGPQKILNAKIWPGKTIGRFVKKWLKNRSKKGKRADIFLFGLF